MKEKKAKRDGVSSRTRTEKRKVGEEEMGVGDLGNKSERRKNE